MANEEKSSEKSKNGFPWGRVGIAAAFGLLIDGLPGAAAFGLVAAVLPSRRKS